MGLSFAAVCWLSAEIAGTRPATNAARHASAKNIVNAETVFSFTPRTGFSTSKSGAAGTAARDHPEFPFVLRVVMRGIAVLHSPTRAEAAGNARIFPTALAGATQVHISVEALRTG